MKRILIFCLGAIILTGVIGFGSVKLYGLLKSDEAKAATCEHKGTEHSVTIANGKVTPAHTTGNLCDTMTVTNTDDVLRYIAFGRHDEHRAYDGITEKTIEKGQSFTITMDELGDYKFHDHLHDEVAGTFTVSAKK